MHSKKPTQNFLHIPNVDNNLWNSFNPFIQNNINNFSFMGGVTPNKTENNINFYNKFITSSKKNHFTTSSNNNDANNNSNNLKTSANTIKKNEKYLNYNEISHRLMHRRRPKKAYETHKKSLGKGDKKKSIRKKIMEKLRKSDENKYKENFIRKNLAVFSSGSNYKTNKSTKNTNVSDVADEFYNIGNGNSVVNPNLNLYTTKFSNKPKQSLPCSKQCELKYDVSINCSFQPEINRNSERISEQLSLDGYPSSERILVPTVNNHLMQMKIKKDKIKELKEYFKKERLLEKDLKNHHDVSNFIEIYNKNKEKYDRILEENKEKRLSQERIIKDYIENNSIHSYRNIVNKRANDIFLNLKMTNSKSKRKESFENIRPHIRSVSDFLLDNEKFLNRKYQNLSLLKEDLDRKHAALNTFRPNINDEIKKDDVELVKFQLPKMQDYIYKRKKRLDCEEKLRVINDFLIRHPFRVKGRKFIKKVNKSCDDFDICRKKCKKNILFFRRKSAKKIGEIRKENDVSDFFNDVYMINVE